MSPLSPTTLETPDTPAYKAPEWATAAIAEGRDPVDAGSNTLAKKIITGLTSLAVATALTLTPVDGQTQNISAEAFKKCEAELISDYSDRIAKVTADGKPHLVLVLEKRRGEAIANLCALMADNAAGRADNAARAEIAAGRAEIAAGRAEIAVYKELELLFIRTKAIADIITSKINLSGKAKVVTAAELQELNTVYVALRDKSSFPGVLDILTKLDTIRGSKSFKEMGS